MQRMTVELLGWRGYLPYPPANYRAGSLTALVLKEGNIVDENYSALRLLSLIDGEQNPLHPVPNVVLQFQLCECVGLQLVDTQVECILSTENQIFVATRTNLIPSVLGGSTENQIFPQNIKIGYGVVDVKTSACRGYLYH